MLRMGGEETKTSKNPFTLQSNHDRLLTAFLAPAFPGAGYCWDGHGERNREDIVFSIDLHGSGSAPKNITCLMKNAQV